MGRAISRLRAKKTEGDRVADGAEVFCDKLVQTEVPDAGDEREYDDEPDEDTYNQLIESKVERFLAELQEFREAELDDPFLENGPPPDGDMSEMCGVYDGDQDSLADLRSRLAGNFTIGSYYQNKAIREMEDEQKNR